MKTKFLVADTSAFISHASLHELAENVITVQGVVDEVRNKRQLRHLSTLTYNIQIKDVDPEHIAWVTQFSKKTGDFISLSTTDIKVIALTYQLEKELVGTNHLRLEPVVARTYNYSCRSSTSNNAAVFNNLLERHNDIEKVTQKAESLSSTSSEESFISVGDTEPYEEEQWHDVLSSPEKFDDDESDNSGSEESEESYTDDEGWITPSNIQHVKNNGQNASTLENEYTVVGCLTTDFAMQNVLKQIGLKVVSFDGRVIKHLRTFILRCYACFKLTSLMTRQFCPHCGNKTLKKVAVSVDDDGNQQVHINLKKPLTSRGKKFSLPTPQGGRHAVNPRLVHDARRPHQRPSRLARMKTDALHTDYVDGMSPFVTRDVYSRSAQIGFNKGKPVFKYWMQKNPNQSRRISRRK